MPRRLENDRWLFGVTLVLCLLGAVMVFSASAVTAEQHYGRSYIFLLRQAACLVIGLFGMFAVMCVDYRRLREPKVVYTTPCAVLLMLVGAFFLTNACDAPLDCSVRWDSAVRVSGLAVILYLAWFLDHCAAALRRWNLQA